ncbi:MAG: SulP family inorganic anion transporter, partial [Bacteroidales bacterium]|nr:SulP family inorganic anion transporter [Bacteroidales bacterium]
LIVMSVTAILCGLFQLLFGITKLGKYIRYIPYPVLSGFMSGVGIIIVLQQIYPLFGLKSPILIIDMITLFPEKLQQGFNIQAFLIGISTILLIYLLPFLFKKTPVTLISLILITIVSVIIGYDSKLIIGEIPLGMPLPFFAKLSLSNISWFTVFKFSVIPAFTLAGLGSIESLLASTVADNITKDKHNSNKELIGQGIGNICAGLFAGVAGAGTTMRTVVNVKSGGRTPLSGIIHALFLLAVLLGLGRYVKFVPLSVLSGILITVGISLIDYKGLKDLFKIPRSDAIVLIVVLLLTVFVNILIAVAIGMVVASVLFMKQASDLVEKSYESGTLTEFNKESPWSDESNIPEEIKNQIYIQRLDGPISFGSITRFQEIMSDIPKNVKIVIIRMKLVSFMDQSGLYAMETAIKDLQANGITVLMTIIQPQPMYMLRNMDIIPGVIHEDKIFKTFEDCIVYLKSIFN